MIPRTTLTTREMENKAIKTLVETFKSELSSFELSLAVDSKTLNSRVKFSIILFKTQRCANHAHLQLVRSVLNCTKDAA